ncbi:MAG: TA system VapC family ribonuclease toxin [Cyanobacteriota bacterium]|nr:TA system VapC family ribonuclease toxin [Cyanobacteriota bacterium]
MRALLDINVIIALLDGQHVLHRAAQAWLECNIDAGWASCPITQNGVIRILSQPTYPNSRPAAEVAARLAEACSHPAHQFWSGGLSLVADGHVSWRRLLGPRQITDAYLLAVAVAEGGRLVTFDQRIGLELVSAARREQLVVITPRP